PRRAAPQQGRNRRAAAPPAERDPRAGLRAALPGAQPRGGVASPRREARGAIPPADPARADAQERRRAGARARGEAPDRPKEGSAPPSGSGRRLSVGRRPGGSNLVIAPRGGRPSPAGEPGSGIQSAGGGAAAGGSGKSFMRAGSRVSDVARQPRVPNR